MQSLTFTNSRGESFALGYSEPYILQGLVGLSSAPIDNPASRGYKQDGQTPKTQLLQARPITYKVIVVGSSMEEIYSRRRTLIRYFRARESFNVIYKNDHISVRFTCRVNEAPTFNDAQEGIFNGSNSCVMSLLCDDPFLLDENESNVTLALSVPKLRFPLVFNPTIIFGLLAQKVFIDNDSDFSVPVIMKFHGPALNPVVENLTTGQLIKINKDILSGEYIEINTAYAKKSVTLVKSNGDRENAFRYIDQTSEFWELEIGSNEIKYDADSGADTATVNISYYKRYMGV